MKRASKATILLCTLLLSFFTNGCSDDKGKQATQEPLLIFCGFTMIAPIRELVDQFEKEHDITVKISYGGSQDLSKSIEINKIGDIFFPGFKSFVDDMAVQGHIDQTAVVGHNQLSLFVAKGNPKNLTGELHQLIDPELAVIIGHEDLGSVGRESKRVLTKLGIYEHVVKNTVFMAADSKGLTVAIREHKADIALNWKAVATLGDNINSVDILEINNIEKKPLVMASLIYSERPKHANDFLALCSSEHGLKVFKKYGF